MGNHHDSIALDWVRGEIQDTLTQGQHALEAYVENRDDTARLRFCLNYLHQVHGTLQMVELYGAALLTEEMEKLTQAVLNETVANTDEAVEVLGVDGHPDGGLPGGPVEEGNEDRARRTD